MTDSRSDEPLVSIVLPTYKRAHLLPHAVRSVLNQTYRTLELIVVDDNSPDDTHAVVESFHDPRIRYVRNDSNLKLPGALNRGFSLSRGEYLTWTSDDNLYAPKAIERMVDTLVPKTCDFVYADYFRFSDLDPDGQPLDPRHDRLPAQLQLEKSNHIGACFMYTRRVYEGVGGYDPDLFLVEDYDYFIRAAKRFTFCHIPEPLYYFRRDDNTLYLSRFCEVKAADILVRCKNGLLDDEAALNAVVALILQNMEGLRNPLLRWSRRLIRNVSYRLTNVHTTICGRYLLLRLRPGVRSILGGYGARKSSFNDAKQMLMTLMQQAGTVAYIKPLGWVPQTGRSN